MLLKGNPGWSGIGRAMSMILAIGVVATFLIASAIALAMADCDVATNPDCGSCGIQIVLPGSLEVVSR